MGSALRGVFFDLDGVLVDSDDASVSFFRMLFQVAGLPPPTDEQFEGAWSMTMREWLMRELGHDEGLVSHLIDLVGTLSYPVELVRIPEGTAQVVAELAKRYTTAVVTSRIKRDALRLIQMADIRTDTLVAFEDYDHPKPDPEPLLIACARLDIAASHAVYVGDADVDVLAAKAAGMSIIRFASEADPRADATISDIRQLPTVLVDTN